jgi:hypothetical protein
MQYVHRNENYGLSNDNETKLASTMVKGQQSEMKTELNCTFTDYISYYL